MLFLLVFFCLIVSFSLLNRAFRAPPSVAPPPVEITEWEFVEDHGIHHLSEEEDSEPDRVLTHESSTSRQPTTDIVFNDRRTGEAGISSDLDDREITTDWQPYFTQGEASRLRIYEQTPDLRQVARTFKSGFDLLRNQGPHRRSLSDLLKWDKLSHAGKKFQTAIRSLIAGASMRGVPAGAACVVTINFAATPALPIWMNAGGAHPRMLKSDYDRKFRAALDEIGCKHILEEGPFEIAKAPKIDLQDRKSGAFVKSYASSSWPSGLKLVDHLDGIAVAHVHRVVVLLDERGQPIAPKALRKALKKRFTAKRAVLVTALGTSRRTTSMTRSAAAEAAIRYALERKKGRQEWEVREQARWAEKLKPEDLWTTGWRSFVAVSRMSVPIMRASLLSRHKLREALVDVDIGCGWSPPRTIAPAPPLWLTYQSIAAGKPLALATPFRAANDNDPLTICRRARDGPWLRAA